MAESIEVFAFACVKTVWKLSQNTAGVAEVIEASSRTCVKIIWKLGQRQTVLAEVVEVCSVSVASVIVNEVEALQYVIVSTQTI